MFDGRLIISLLYVDKCMLFRYIYLANKSLVFKPHVVTVL